jgi:DNA repair protein RecO (recombination protein O)
MEWRDEGILIGLRRHGETAALVEVFTRDHGRHAGLVRGGGSRRMAPLLQPGGQVAVEWRARLDEHLGTFRIDPVRARPGIMANGATLAAMASVSALLAGALPERVAHGALYAATFELLDALDAARDWPAHYARWELALLAALGFGLDLGACAATGRREGLAFVSPRSGRAVSADGAGEWAPRLLPLPRFLVDPAAPVTGIDIADALALSGFFLETQLAPMLARERLPPARARAAAAILALAGPPVPQDVSSGGRPKT